MPHRTDDGGTGKDATTTASEKRGQRPAGGPARAGVGCPECGAAHVHRSHTRTRTERLRRRVTGKTPFRCMHCGWRGWLRAAEQREPAAKGPSPYVPESPPPALDDVDRAMGMGVKR
ncbi:MAG: hypothetical protein ACE148_17310 [Vicinamibacterales bacterium]